MLDDWFTTIKLSLSWRQFHQLPQNSAYKYEYLNKTAWLSPRPKFYSVRLQLRGDGDEEAPQEIDAHEPIGFRRLAKRDWLRLSQPFAGAFHRVQPFASLSDRRRLAAARACLKFTREGGDGPVIEPACHVAFRKQDGSPRGAILLTLIPMTDLNDLWRLRWEVPPPPDSVERRLGRPHLTWIFVGPLRAGHGIGTALLAHASKSLVELGYDELTSSFILGNTSSMLWHWRCGFELLPYAGSMRAIRARRVKPDSRPENSS
jgi:GNAT superfamily N-acetyltransferase